MNHLIYATGLPFPFDFVVASSTDARRRYINWVTLDRDWEGEFCRVAGAHSRVKASVKNHNLGLEVPYQAGSESRRYRRTSSSSSTTAMATTIRSTSLSRSKATVARTPRRRTLLWRHTGSPG